MAAARKPHPNAKPDGPLTPAERDALIGRVLGRHPRPAALLHAAYPSTLRRAKFLGLSDDDVHSACLLGVWSAARLFDPARGLRFSTYLAFHMRAKVKAECRRAERDLRRLARHGRRVVSADAVVAGTEGLTLAEVIPARSPGHAEPELTRAVAAAVARLVPQHSRRLAVTLRWGLDGQPKRTGAEVGRLLGVSKQAVQQYEQLVLHACLNEFEALYRTHVLGE